MKDAKTLLMEVLAAIPDGMRLQLFLPMTVRWSSHYLYSLGIERRYQGHAAIRDFYDLVKQLNPDFAFKPEDTHVLIELRTKFSRNISPTQPAPRPAASSTIYSQRGLLPNTARSSFFESRLMSSPQLRRLIPTASLLFKVSRPRLIRPAPNIGAKESRQF
jgi:hypothetical protein